MNSFVHIIPSIILLLLFSRNLIFQLLSFVLRVTAKMGAPATCREKFKPASVFQDLREIVVIKVLYEANLPLLLIIPGDLLD